MAKGQGHDDWECFFRCQALVEFAIARAHSGAARPARSSGQDLADHPAVHVGESAPDAVVVEGQALVVEAE